LDLRLAKILRICNLPFFIGALLVFGGVRPIEAAALCAGEVIGAAPAITRAQVISDTLQPASSMFVCRVDGASTPTGASSIGTRSVTPAGLLLLVLARWLHFVGYALGFGTITFGLWAKAALAEWPARMQRLWRLVHAGIGLLLCAEPLALLAQTIGVRGALLDLAVAGDVLASGFGLVWAQRIGIALLLWVLVGVAKDGTVRALWVVPALGLALATIDGAAGAAGASLVTIRIATATLHEAAMGAWIGSLALLLALWNDLDHDQRASIVARFSQVSGAAIGVLVITGLVMAAIQIAQPAGLFATFYGTTLLAKLLVALIAIGLAAFGPRMYREIWRWRAALAALIVVLGVAGLLVSLPSP
jgi:putative copper export protein